MRVDVDEAGGDRLPGTIEHFSRFELAEIANGGDRAPADCDVGPYRGCAATVQYLTTDEFEFCVHEASFGRRDSIKRSRGGKWVSRGCVQASACNASYADPAL